MDERSSKRKKQAHDFSITSFRVVQEATEAEPESERLPDPTPEEVHAAVLALGRLGGDKGGKARAEKQTAKRSRSASCSDPLGQKRRLNQFVINTL